MADKEVKSVGFSLTKSMIKLVQDVDSGIIPLEGEKQEDGVEWVKNKDGVLEPAGQKAKQVVQIEIRKDMTHVTRKIRHTTLNF